MPNIRPEETLGIYYRCPVCGEEIELGDKYCAECGEPIEWREEERTDE